MTFLQKNLILQALFISKIKRYEQKNDWSTVAIGSGTLRM